MRNEIVIDKIYKGHFFCTNALMCSDKMDVAFLLTLGPVHEVFCDLSHILFDVSNFRINV